MPVLMGATSPVLCAFWILGIARVGAPSGGSLAKGISNKAPITLTKSGDTTSLSS